MGKQQRAKQRNALSASLCLAGGQRVAGRDANKALFPMMECVTRWEIKMGETA